MGVTKLLFMDGFDVTAAEAVITNVVLVDDRVDVQTVQTCFYPRGGGQDWDQGVMRSDGAEFRVEEVRLDENGMVHHIGTFTSGSFAAGDAVRMQVDEDRRALNTRLHSAGHLVDMAVDELSYDWVPGKGSHYPHMSNVEYTGSWDAEQRDEIIVAIQQKINEYVEQGGANEIKFMSLDEMSSVCRHVPDYIPKNKPARVVIYRGTFGVPCGGTHVADLSEVGKVNITKIKKKDGKIRVSYTLDT